MEMLPGPGIDLRDAAGRKKSESVLLKRPLFIFVWACQTLTLLNGFLSFADFNRRSFLGLTTCLGVVIG